MAMRQQAKSRRRTMSNVAARPDRPEWVMAEHRRASLAALATRLSKPRNGSANGLRVRRRDDAAPPVS
jgi:hypothetical protein